jgi:uncharacterized protein (TIGR02145 family)
MKKKDRIWIYSLIIIGLILILNWYCKRVNSNTVKDIDGNVYKTVLIGKYKWMAENLKTTTYNNGTDIPNVTDQSAWLRLSIGAYCWYNNNESYADTFGLLYNWYAVNTGYLCPDG